MFMDKAKRTEVNRAVTFILDNKALLILLILGTAIQILTGGLFLNASNISSIVRQISTSVVLGVGFTAVLASGGVDLSVGQMLSLMGILYAHYTLLMPLPLAILAALLSSVLLGCLNGVLSVTFRLPAFIVTLATAQVFKGFAYLLCDGKSVGGLSNAVKKLGSGIVFGVPVSAIVVLVLAAIMAIMLHRTKLGRHIIATGGNAAAAKASGVRVERIQILGYVLMGICVAIAAMLLTGRVSTALPGAGEGMEMDAIAATNIGGTPMSGGYAKVSGTIFGCLIIGIINNGLNLLDVSSFWQWVAKGAVIIFAILIDAQTERFFNKRRVAL